MNVLYLAGNKRWYHDPVFEMILCNRPDDITVVQGEPIYEEQYRRYLSSKATMELAKVNPKEGPLVVRLNQGLLAEAYPTLGDDVLDTFGVHAVGGTMGAFGTTMSMEEIVAVLTYMRAGEARRLAAGEIQPPEK